MPYIRRLPKRGFSNSHTRVEYHAVNLSDLERSFEAGATVDVEAIMGAGLANGAGDVLVKILAKGELTKKLSVTAHSSAARQRPPSKRLAGCTELRRPPERSKGRGSGIG